jgi:hypothetical protein
MGVNADSKEYYESQNQTKVLYIPNLTMYLTDLNKQMLKLPHMTQDPSSNYEMGCTREDIEESILRGVENLYVMLAPSRMILSTKKGELQQFNPSNKYMEKSNFYKAMEKLEWCYILMEETDILNDRLIDIDLPDDDGSYDFGGANNDSEEPGGSLPAPVEAADDKAVGAVAEENKPPVA